MIAYLDLPSGLSGDMLLGCLIDCGWGLGDLRRTIAALHLPAGDWAVQVQEVRKGPLRATRVDVLVDEVSQRRNLADVRSIIDQSSDLPAAVKEQAVAIFTRLASAEARVHGTTVDQIHFHEVGALDAIVDIVGCVSGLHALGVERLYASAIPLGHGWAETAHGRLPLPAPATLELLTQAQAPICPAPGRGELVTPTAAAILAEMATFQQPPMTLSRIGVGAGQKEFAWPNVARMWLGAAHDSKQGGPLVQLETNIDDMSPQLYAAVIDQLFAAGALDVWLTPVQMKKGRPGVVVSVLGKAGDQASLAHMLLLQTTTLGVRVHTLQHRYEAEREERQVETPYGPVRVKIKRVDHQPVGAMPEYDDCRRIAEAASVPLRIVHEAATAAGQALLVTLRGEAGSSANP